MATQTVPGADSAPILSSTDAQATPPTNSNATTLRSILSVSDTATIVRALAMPLQDMEAEAVKVFDAAADASQTAAALVKLGLEHLPNNTDCDVARSMLNALDAQTRVFDTNLCHLAGLSEAMLHRLQTEDEPTAETNTPKATAAAAQPASGPVSPNPASATQALVQQAGQLACLVRMAFELAITADDKGDFGALWRLRCMLYATLRVADALEDDMGVIGAAA